LLKRVATVRGDVIDEAIIKARGPEALCR
jgi:hypothetical protein